MNENNSNQFIVSGSINSKVVQDSATELTINDQKQACSIHTDDNQSYQVKVGNKTICGELISIKQNQCTIIINGNTYQLSIDNKHVVERKKHLGIVEELTITQIKAPLPGKVCDVLVSEESQVNAGDPLFILEAMKMHNEICSPVAGVITKILVKSDETVSSDQILIEVDSTDIMP